MWPNLEQQHNSGQNYGIRLTILTTIKAIGSSADTPQAIEKEHKYAHWKWKMNYCYLLSKF